MAFLMQNCGYILETIEKFKLGWDGERVWIPIIEKEKVINIRKYNPSSKKGIKIIGLTGRNEMRLWPQENLQHEEIYLMEGEKDCILANQLGLPAVTVTAGAGSFKKEWLPYFTGKKVYICYDIDKAGVEGAKKVANIIGRAVEALKLIALPIKEPANADFTDYIVHAGFTANDFKKLCEKTPLTIIEAPLKVSVPDEVFKTTLDSASNARYFFKRIESKVIIAGKDLAPYLVPRIIKAKCQMGRKSCSFCGIGEAGGEIELEFNELIPETLRLINCTNTQQGHVVKDVLKIGGNCTQYTYQILEAQNIEEIKLIPEIDYTQDAKEYVVRTAFLKGHGVGPNQTYLMEAITMPNPQNQYATHMVYKMTNAKSNIDSFKMTKEIRKELEIFQGDPDEKLKEIHKDLSYNVTKIYQRDDLLMAFDMVYFSPLRFKFQGKLIKKGWCEGLVIGDTRCGKTETSERLTAYYQLGEVASGENASFAGIVGGLQQTQKRWNIIWGKLPLNDRKLLIIDEVSGLRYEDIANMSSIRSSGIAEITKIQTERTMARTRILWLSNPRIDQPVNYFNSGVDIIKNLIGKPEDIARFDFALILANDEVSIDVINNSYKTHVEHKYNKEVSRDLILWAWSRNVDDIIIDEKTTDVILEMSLMICEKYSSDCPVVVPSEQKLKIAKLSIALASRLFSTDDGERIIVKPEHAEYAYAWLDSIYSKPCFSYNLWSKNRKQNMELVAKEDIERELGQYGDNFVNTLLEMKQIRVTDLEEALGIERSKAKMLLAMLLSNKALKKMYSFYVKTPAFIGMLRKLQAEALEGK